MSDNTQTVLLIILPLFLCLSLIGVAVYQKSECNQSYANSNKTAEEIIEICKVKL